MSRGQITTSKGGKRTTELESGKQSPTTVILPVVLAAAAYEKYRRRCLDVGEDDAAKQAADDIRSLANTYFSPAEPQV